MVFNSFSFLFAYLPIVLVIYYLCRRFLGRPWTELCLIVASLVFYGIGYPKCLPVLLLSLIVNYVWGYFLYRFHKRRKCFLGTGITLNVLVLIFFKYAKLVPALQNIELDAPGISFFTFTQIAFLVETYRGRISRMSVWEYGAYVTFFPKLMEGPIMLPTDWETQSDQNRLQAQEQDQTQDRVRNQNQHQYVLNPAAKSKSKSELKLALRPSETKDEWWERLIRILILISFGLFKKVILADTLGQAVTAGYDNVAALNVVDAWIVMLSYTLQLYFDFSGYCDIAMGIAAFLGYDLPLNFDSPYRAVHIIDFWKRWHKTLTAFLTQYVYIPLGGNRKGAFRMYLNFLIVFLISGIWHGAGWQFVLWGMMHGVLYVITRAILELEKKGKLPGMFKRVSTGVTGRICHAAGVLLTFLYVNIAWVFFRASSVKEGLQFLQRLVLGGGGKVSRSIADTFNLDEFWYMIKVLHLDAGTNSYFYVMVLFLVACLLLIWACPNAVRLATKCKLNAGIVFLAAILFVWSVISFSGVSTFLYFNF